MEIFHIISHHCREKYKLYSDFSIVPLLPLLWFFFLSSCTKVYSNNLHKNVQLNFGYLYAQVSQWKIMTIPHHYLLLKFPPKFKIWNFVTPLSLSGCAWSKLLNNLIFSNFYFIETKIVIPILCHSSNRTININSNSQIHNYSYYLSSDGLLIGK